MKETEIEKEKFGSSGWANEPAIYQTLRFTSFLVFHLMMTMKIGLFLEKIGLLFPLQM
jgi:hypothetical protein